MAIYAVYVKNSQLYNNIVPIKDGFSFIAAIFTVFWALYNKMWVTLLVLIIINSALGILQVQFAAQNICFIIHIIIMLTLGILATDLKECDLQNKGYELKDIVFASSEQEAEIQFLRNYQS